MVSCFRNGCAHTYNYAFICLHVCCPCFHIFSSFVKLQLLPITTASRALHCPLCRGKPPARRKSKAIPGKPQGFENKWIQKCRPCMGNANIRKQYKYYLELQKHRHIRKPCKYRNTETSGNHANTIYDGRGPAGPMFQFIYDRT